MCVAVTHICALILFGGLGAVAAQCAAEPVILKGILGKTLDLSFGDLQNISKIILKKKMDRGLIKLLEYDVPAKNHILREPPSLRFNEISSTVTLLRLQREDEGEYVLVKEFGRSEHPCTVIIKVYDQITNMSIDRIIIRHNDTRVVILNCTAEAGDEVSFSWRRGEEILNHSSNVLRINLNRESELCSYTCIARNPVSVNSISTTSNTGSSTPKGQIPTPVFILAVSLGAVVLLITVIPFVFWKRKPCRRNKIGSFSLTPPDRTPAPIQHEPQDMMANTIYSAIQKVSLPTPEVSTVYELAGPFNQNGGAS